MPGAVSLANYPWMVRPWDLPEHPWLSLSQTSIISYPILTAPYYTQKQVYLLYLIKK